MVELEAAWKETTSEWARQRLMVIRLAAQHVLNAEQIAVAADVSRRSVFRYLDAFLTGGVEALLKREHKGGRQPTLAGADREAFLAQLRDGKFRRAKTRRRGSRRAPSAGYRCRASMRCWEKPAGS